MAEGMEIIRRITPEEEYNAGLVIFRQGGVHPLEDENGFLRYAVDGDPRRIVRVGATTKLSGRCSCDFFGNVHKPCRHLAAAMMQAISTGAIEEMRRRRARENAGALMGTLQSALPMETPLEMEITLRLLGEREPVRVSLRVGQERMYVVKSMAQFLRGLQEKTAIAFGKGFVKRCGDTFLAVGSIIGGVMFLLCPNTSLPMYPFFHYITFQSFLYHSIMIYLGILVIMRGYVVLRAKDQIPYGTVVLIVGVVAYLVNSVLGTNLMFVSDNFPGTPVELVYRFTGRLFPLCMILIHIVPPFWVMYGISRLVEKRRRKAEKQQETPQGR